MNFVLDASITTALGWTLIHSLWQCLLVAAGAWAGLRMLRNRGAQARYALACGGLALMIALPAATFGLLWTPLRVTSGPGLDGAEVALLVARASTLPTEASLRPVLPWLIAAWTAGVAVMTLRLAGGWLWIQRLRWVGVEAVEDAWRGRMDRLVQALRLHQPVHLLQSRAVAVPMVLGWLRPVVLVPAAVFTGLPPEALEAILAHELAHVRRHDYLVNLLQSAVEVLLFFHPAVWWLSAQIRSERENCCDDIAVSLCGDPLRYARALAALEELRATFEPQPTLALAATGGTLMNRIRRLITPKLPPSPAARAGLVAALAVSVLGAASTLSLTQAPPKAAEPKKEIREEHKVVTVVVNSDSKAPRKLKVKMQGPVKIQPEAQPPVALEEGGRLELEGRDGDKLRSYVAERGPGGEKRVWTLEGKELAPDAAAEAWLKKSLESIRTLQARPGGELRLGHLPEFAWTPQDAKREQAIESAAKALEEQARLLAEKRLAKGTSEAELAELQKEVAKQAREIATQAKKLAEHRIQFDKRELKVIVEQAKAEAEKAKKEGEGLERHKVIVLRAPKADASLHLEDETCLEDVTEETGPGKEKHRIVIRKQLGEGGDNNPAVEIEALKKAIASMQKRLESLQKKAPAK